jgi:hypothetical protein
MSRAVCRPFSDAQLLCNSGPRKPLCAQRGNPRGIHELTRTAEPLSFRTGIPQPGLHALHDLLY